jgi:hypothetical protein
MSAHKMNKEGSFEGLATVQLSSVMIHSITIICWRCRPIICGGWIYDQQVGDRIRIYRRVFSSFRFRFPHSSHAIGNEKEHRSE